MEALLIALGEEITDAEEETFVLFAQDIPSHELGILDAGATTLDVTVGKRDYTIRQSPGLLSSNRAGGTTGAVVWKVSPLFAEWISSDDNVFFETGILHRSSVVVELGAGISGLVALALAPHVGRYVLTDQGYALKLLAQNIAQNQNQTQDRHAPVRRSSKTKSKRTETTTSQKHVFGNVKIMALDWETDAVASNVLDDGIDGVNVVVACDCIYNESLVPPFVQTCIELCRLDNTNTTPGICIVAQQLRSPQVFGDWLDQMLVHFRVWRMPDALTSRALHAESGFVVHVAFPRRR